MLELIVASACAIGMIIVFCMFIENVLEYTKSAWIASCTAVGITIVASWFLQTLG